MKRKTTTLLILCTLFTLCTLKVHSQIDGLDATKYYQIVNYVGGLVIGIDDENPDLDGALVALQDPSIPSDGNLWQIIPINDSVYFIKNKRSEMALGLTDWRGTNPFWPTGVAGSDDTKKQNLTMPEFNWNGQHKGACQREFDETLADSMLMWQPTLFPANSSTNDTILYRMTMAWHLRDSGLAFNVWERKGTIDWVNMRDICLFPGVKEAALYDGVDGPNTSWYAYYFLQTSENVPIVSVNDVKIKNFNIYSANRNIIIKGEILNESIEVYNILGELIYQTTAPNSEINIKVNQGVYIIRVNNSVSKIAIQ